MDRRTQILDAAAHLIEERGFRQTSVDDVIKRSGLAGKAHFYHYFKSKDALGYEVLERQFERFTERGLAILREPMIEPLDRLSLFIDSVIALQAASGCRGSSPFGGFAAEMAEQHEGFRTRLHDVFERWATQLQSLLWEARDHLGDEVDPVRMSRFIIATLEGALLMSRVSRDLAALQGIGTDLKRYVTMHLRDGVAA